jgi:preprotein translocase subunit SecE
LLVNKLSSFDPFGCGIEMEANKPNWFDSLNGLPGLFGSSACETFELKRLLIFIKNALEANQIPKIAIAEELYNFLKDLDTITNKSIDLVMKKITTIKIGNTMKDMFKLFREVYREDRKTFWEDIIGSVLIVGLCIFMYWFVGTFCYDM